MKICFITPNLLPVPNVLGGAIETIITNVLKEQEKNNSLDITVVSIYNKLAYQESKKYQNTKFIYIKKNPLYIFFSIIYKLENKIFKKDKNTYNHMVLRKIKKHNYDYIFAEGGHYNSFNTFLKYFDKNKMILHLHHTGTSNEIIDNTFSKVVGVSNYVINKFKNSSSIKNYYLLKNCINLDDFKKLASSKELNEIRNKYHIKKDDFVILYCGRLIKEKGVLELIKAFNKVNNNHMKLLIIGSKNFYYGETDNYVDALYKNANDNIIFTGYINTHELYKYYQLSKIMVIPSIWEEAAGLVCIEAMISQLPIITTGSGGILEYVSDKSLIVSNQKSKMIDDLSKAILKLYQEKDKLENIGKYNYQEALKYSSATYYQELVKLIREDMNNEKKEY